MLNWKTSIPLWHWKKLKHSTQASIQRFCDVDPNPSLNLDYFWSDARYTETINMVVHAVFISNSQRFWERNSKRRWLHITLFHSPELASELQLPALLNLENSFVFFFTGHIIKCAVRWPEVSTLTFLSKLLCNIAAKREQNYYSEFVLIYILYNVQYIRTVLQVGNKKNT